MAKMGMGVLVAPGTIFKRKFRWGLSIMVFCTGETIGEEFVKLAARPSIDIDETEINMKHGKTWIPGKASWETITVTFYDVVGDGAANKGITAIYGWLVQVYDFTKGISDHIHMGSARKDYSGEVTLNMYDACGNILEQWLLKDAWPKAINFQDLDYSSSDEATVELTLRYSDVSYNENVPGCYKPARKTCCTSCIGTP